MLNDQRMSCAGRYNAIGKCITQPGIILILVKEPNIVKIEEVMRLFVV
jgi:hypothetical protein